MRYIVCAGAIFCAMAFCAVGLSVSNATVHNGYDLRIEAQETPR